MNFFDSNDDNRPGWWEVLAQHMPAGSDLVRAMRRIQSAQESEDLIGGVASLERCLDTQPDLVWSLARGAESRDAALGRFVEFPGFQPIMEGASGLQVCAPAGSRCQLRHDFSEPPGSELFVHVLIRTRFEDLPEVFSALRWVHGSDAEEVMLRFRHASVVAGQRLEVGIPSGFNLFSLGRLGGADLLFINGMPVYWRTAAGASQSGVSLDFIGGSQGLCGADIALFMVSRRGLPVYCGGADFGRLLESMVAACADARDLEQMSRWLHGLEALEHCFPFAVYEQAVEAVLAQPEAYRDYLADLLVRRLPLELRADALSSLSEREPGPVVKAEDVSVSIASNPSKHASLARLFGRREARIELLKGVELRAYAGDIVGIIGQNGAGKTTFLKTLVAAMPLSRGRISVDGRPVLLRPGAGMQGDLTGRENVIKTGLYMGYLPEELNDLMDEIVAFAELEEHIDRPFRYYSDGMRARLVFALATAIPRDILLFDELLSAGDMGFQRRAMERLDGFIRKAKLVFVVQHTFDFVLSRCTKCLLLDHGRPVYFGDPAIATEIYKESL